jgi:hypothetical protein
MSDLEGRISRLSPDKRALLEQQLLRRRSSSPAETIPRQERDGPYELSFPQQRLWFLEQLAPGEPTYNAVLAMRVAGPLSVVQLERGLRTVIERHEPLRTVFRLADDGAPRQVVLDDWRFAIDVRDLRTAAPDAREREMLRQSREAARRPFDLANDLMLRVVVLRLRDEEHVALFVEHHIAFDGWSDGQLFRELGELATAEAEHREPILDPLPIRYRDWSVWHRERLRGDDLDRLVSFWRETLAGAPPSVDLPLDHPRPPQQAFAGAHHHQTFGHGLSESVRTLARAQGATPFMVLLAATAAALHRWSGHDDFVFGSPIANRERPELEHLIGFFSNTFVLRLRTDGAPTFRELVLRARAVALSAFEHQDLPFESLVVAVRPARDPRVNPIFQVNFRVQTQAPYALRLPGLAIVPFDLDIGFSRFDLALEFAVAELELEGYVEYNTALFEAATIRRLAARIERLVADALSRPDAPIGELAWAPPAGGAIRGHRRPLGGGRRRAW